MSGRSETATWLAMAAAVITGPALARGANPLLKPATAPTTVGESAGSPVTADVNEDGRSDLLIPADKQLVVLLSGREGFVPAAASPFALAEGSSETVATDLNGDGKVDVALAHHDSYAVTVMLGDGRGGFAPADGSPFMAVRGGSRPHTHGLAAGDFNGDGIVDLATANQDDGTVAVLLGDGAGRFAPSARSPFPCGRSPYPFDVADVDGDGKLDVLVPNSLPGLRTLTLLRGDGKGGLAAGETVKTAGGAFYVAAGDLNGDGWPDAVVTHNDDDRATVLLNDGRGGLAQADGSPLTLGHNCWGAAITDMNADGKPDLVTAGGDAVRVFLGDGHGGLAAAPGSPYPAAKGTWRLSIGDLNADGKNDIVAKGVEERRMVILMGQ